MVSSYSTYSRGSSTDVSSYTTPYGDSFSPVQTGSLWGLIDLETISTPGILQVTLEDPNGASTSADHPIPGRSPTRAQEAGTGRPGGGPLFPQLNKEGLWTFIWSYEPQGASQFTKIASNTFTYRYDFMEHLMVKNVQTSSPWMWSNQSNTFYQDDTYAYTWAEADNVSDDLYAKWDFYEPNGNLYSSPSPTYTISLHKQAIFTDMTAFMGGSR